LIEPVAPRFIVAPLRVDVGSRRCERFRDAGGKAVGDLMFDAQAASLFVAHSDHLTPPIAAAQLMDVSRDLLVRPSGRFGLVQLGKPLIPSLTGLRPDGFGSDARVRLVRFGHRILPSIDEVADYRSQVAYCCEQ